MSQAKWFVVHTYSGYENKVAQNIKTVAKNRGMDNEILDAVVPTEKVKQVKDGEEKEVERKLFPGYVLVKAIWYRPSEKKKTSRTVREKENEFDNSQDDELSMDDDAWYVVRNTRGVTGFVGPDSKPSPLKDEELYTLGLEKREDNDDDFDSDLIDVFDFKVEVNYNVGDRLTVISGQFEGASGICKEIDLEKESVTVLLPLFGRETPTELPLDAVMKAGV